MLLLLAAITTTLVPASARAATVLVETTSLMLRDDATPPLDPRHRKLTFRSSTTRAAANRIVPPAPGSADDPTLAGATLHVANAAGSGEIVHVALPAIGWAAQGTAAHPRGFVFRDRSPNAPVSQVTIGPDRITVRATGAGWTYTLDEAQQGRVALRLDLGGSVWCGDAAARASGNPPSTASSDAPGRFSAQSKSPPPAVCALNRLTCLLYTSPSPRD